MNAITGKRITYKRICPNPLFEECLEKLYEEAKSKNTKYEPIIKEAMSSLSKYPLPLKSGADCAILKGFNRPLCLLLDKYVSEAISKEKLTLKTVTAAEIIDLENYNSSGSVENLSSKTVTKEVIDVENCNSLHVDSEIHEVESNNMKNQLRLSTCSHKSKKGVYIPKFRSGAYAILMGLLEHNKQNLDSNLTKDEIIKVAQKYSEESFTVAKSVRYSAWSSMGRLLTKGLVAKRRGKKIQFVLTEKGASMANKLWDEYQTKSSTNTFIFHEPQPKEDCSNIQLSNDLTHLQEADNYLRNDYNSPKDISFIHLPANCYDIILLIDKNEKNGNEDPFQIYPNLNYESRSLKVGDFTWIARHHSSSQELVLPYIVERKRMDDLGASIKDGRFHEQKFRLRKCGLQNVFYLVESHEKNKHVGLPMPSLMQALANTRIQDGFKIYYTDSLIKTHRFLAMMTKRLQVEYMNKSLYGVNNDPREEILMTFDYFSKSSIKTKVLNVTEMFIKMLLQLKGMSVDKALAITNVYKTPKSLITAYESCDEKKGVFLLAHLKYGDLNRNVGPSVSKTVYQLFTFNCL